MPQIFLCYAKEDEAQVREIYIRLQEEGFQPWMDKIDLLPGQRWEQEISRAIRDSDFILIILSQNSVQRRGFFQREYKLALDTLQELPEDTIHTIPVRLDDCEVPEAFRPLHWANLFEEDGFDLIVQALRAGVEQRSEQDGEYGQQASLAKREQIEEVIDNLAQEAGEADSVGEPEALHDDVEQPELKPAQPSITNSLGMEFVLIPAGKFMMGSNDGDSDEKPVHKVTISQPFYLGKHEVTQRQWEAVMESNPSRFTGDSNRPVENVSWADAQTFIQKLNERESGKTYRLPTEAEWEYACRAGTTTAYSFGDDPGQLGEYAWYSENSGDKTHQADRDRHPCSLRDVLGRSTRCD